MTVPSMYAQKKSQRPSCDIYVRCLGQDRNSWIYSYVVGRQFISADEANTLEALVHRIEEVKQEIRWNREVYKKKNRYIERTDIFMKVGRADQLWLNYL